MHTLNEIEALLRRVGYSRQVLWKALAEKDRPRILSYLARATVTGITAQEMADSALAQYDASVNGTPEAFQPLPTRTDPPAPKFNTQTMTSFSIKEPTPREEEISKLQEETVKAVKEILVVEPTPEIIESIKKSDPALKDFIESGGVTPGFIDPAGKMEETLDTLSEEPEEEDDKIELPNWEDKDKRETWAKIVQAYVEQGTDLDDIATRAGIEPAVFKGRWGYAQRLLK